MPHTHEPIIKLTQVDKTYRTDAGDFPALRQIELAIEPGQFIGIIGKSGSGKSTLINMLTGIDRATSGHIVIDGTDVTTLKEGDMAVWRGKHMGIVFQFFQLLPTLTVAENIMLPMDFCNTYQTKQRWNKALELLDLVGLKDQANKFPGELSGGQQQRIAIARALANDPPIIAADEPTGNLDSKTAEQVFELFRDLVSRGKTIIMVTHDRDLAKKVDRSIIIADGQVIEEYLISTFASLTDQQLVWLTSQVVTTDYDSGETIIKEGEESSNFYVIMQGSVDVVLEKKKQKKILESFGRGKYFGEIELLHDTKSVATVNAGTSGARIGVINKDVFQEVLHRAPQIKTKLNEEAGSHLQDNKRRRKEA